MPNFKLSFLSIVLLVKIPETIFGRIFLLHSSNNHNFKDKSGRERTRKHGKEERASEIYREVLSGKKSCPERRRAETVDKRSVKEQHVQERRPKEEGQKRVRRVREKKRMKEGVRRKGRKGYASPWAMQPERRIIRIYLCTYKTVLVSPRRSRIV